MSERPKQVVLLEAYEELTRKESVCLREANIEVALEVQAKKAKLLDKIAELQKTSPLNGDIEPSFSEKVAELESIEISNAQVLEEAMKKNRDVYRIVTKRSDSAGKVRNAYGISKLERKAPSSLRGQA
ncbi:hypothetical protein MLD52_04910 [Puniceicoccaceae bacterium K14]|nr:hypothetical protein [Puniceicoccaceae bacterium K14]